MQILYVFAYTIRFFLFTIAQPLPSGLSYIKSEKLKVHWQICGTKANYPLSPDFHKIDHDRPWFFIQVFPEGYCRISSF